MEGGGDPAVCGVRRRRCPYSEVMGRSLPGLEPRETPGHLPSFTYPAGTRFKTSPKIQYL
jgi:hypothetical protein